MRVSIIWSFAAVVLCIACAQSPGSGVVPLSGTNAMSHVRAMVAFGPRPAGSEALQECRDYVTQQLKGFGYAVDEDAFEAQTPYGTKHMVNLIAHKGASSKGIIALASHYDTATKESFKFVGANDGGSSTGLLLELARVLAGNKDELEYRFLFLDGEEAFVEWSSFDSTYGSRHLARKWKEDGTAARVRALILLDMIGDKNLDILKDRYSTRWLSDLVWETAANAGLQGILSGQESYIEDDHIAFLDAGIPCLDLIDLNYGPNNSYWHTKEDTLDKISGESMEKTGKLVLAVLPFLQKKLSGR